MKTKRKVNVKRKESLNKIPYCLLYYILLTIHTYLHKSIYTYYPYSKRRYKTRHV